MALNRGPGRVGLCKETLAAELRIHAIVDVVHPAAERGGGF
jgi:hypothetical protein